MRMGQQPSVPEDMDQTLEVLSTASGRSVVLSVVLSVCPSVCCSSSELISKYFSVVR